MTAQLTISSFINGGNSDSKGIKTSKNKKKNRRRKDPQKRTSPDEAIETSKKGSDGLNSLFHSAEVDNEFQSSTSNMSKLQGAPKVEFDGVDIDDEIDPALKEKIDREVEDFARRLNSDWPERMQELLSLGQERRPVHFAINGNGTMGGYGSMCSFPLWF
ncbi:hypothetical protein JCGZ_14389 [Jatropha curcas]|uniref:SKP1 component POZ domain-containing protein n=1 Tax=Jatropha curcas TaxID=180498 RepID=A0A067K0M6_JATCU|nr:hypothetical protein JCGZ_14389 [Jatropha curcas]